MNNNNEIGTYEVNYLDVNAEIVHTDVYKDLTRDAAEQHAVNDCPPDRQIEDWSVIKID